ncbi:MULTISPECIES: YcgN family cysteine cluster protein [unclassified Moraxella]|uniref:YcgN family cysteine cluster protein n=1 Tax=unclassified Moraxella TaxID=2685852 RepID=UPI003AF9504B
MSQPVTLRPQFWERFALAEFTNAEWEALCDGCGACCLIKFKDDDTGEVEYTDVACQLLDCATASCSKYATRREYVPDCISLSVENIGEMDWLPASCAYKRLFLGQRLPNWHYLITQDKAVTAKKMRQKNISMAGRCVSESHVSEWEQEQRVIHWIKQV